MHQNANAGFRRSRNRARFVAAAAIAGALGVGCQLLLTDDSATQCSSTSDCAARGFSFAICGPESTCINPPAFCTKNEECIPPAGKTGECLQNACVYKPIVPGTPANFCKTGDDPACVTYFKGKPAHCVKNTCELYPPRHCFKNSDCIAQSKADGGTGTPAICQNETCKDLLSEDCSTILGTEKDYAQDNVVIFGLMAVTAGSAVANQGLGAVGATAVARNHFYQTFGGLPDPTTAAKARPFIYLVCNEYVDFRRATAHLLDLKVPAIIGPAQSAVIYTVAQEITGPAGVLTLSPSGTTGSVALIKSGLHFRVFPSDTDHLQLWDYLVKGKEAQFQNNGTVTGDNFKVAVMHTGEITGTYLAPLMRDKFVFNGKSGADNLADMPPKMALINFGYNPGQSQASSDAQTAKAITDLIAFKPHVTILLGAGELFDIMKTVEAQWPAGDPYRTTYMPYSNASGFAFRTWIAGNNELRSRVIFPGGAVPKVGDALAASVRLQAASEFTADYPNGYTLGATAGSSGDGGVDAGDAGDGGVPPVVGSFAGASPLCSADTGHLLPFAAVGALAAADGGAITGAGLASVLKNQVGTGGIQIAITGGAAQPLQDGVARLQAGGKIDYYGITSSINFDATNTQKIQGQISCVAGPPANLVTRTGIQYDPIANIISGTCGGVCASTAAGGACPPP